MKADEQMVKRVLQVLAGGGSCDYNCIQTGNVMLFDGKGGHLKEGIDISTFIELKSEGLIGMINSMRHGHIVFHGRVDSYGITTKGREYLNRE